MTNLRVHLMSTGLENDLLPCDPPRIRSMVLAQLFRRFVRFCGRKPGSFIGIAGTPRPPLLLAPQQVFPQRLCRPLAARLRLPLRFPPAFTLAVLLRRGIAIASLIVFVLHDRWNTANPRSPEVSPRFPPACPTKYEICGLHSATSYGNRPSLAPDNTDPPHDAAIAQG